MALYLHRAERTDVLADGLGALLAEPLPDPFAEELVLVPARGVERWLSQRLSHVLGADTVAVTGFARGWYSAVPAHSSPKSPAPPTWTPGTLGRPRR